MYIVAEMGAGNIVYKTNYRWHAQRRCSMLAEAIHEQPFCAELYEREDGPEIGSNGSNIIQRELIVAADVHYVIFIGKSIHDFLRCGIGYIPRPRIFIRLVFATAIGLQQQRLAGGEEVLRCKLVSEEGLLPAVEEKLRQFAVVGYAEHPAPYFYKVRISLNKRRFEIRIVCQYPVLVPAYVLLVEIAKLIEIERLVHIFIAQEYLGVAGDHYQLVGRVIFFDGLAYCCGGYALAYPAIYLEDYFHKIYCLTILFTVRTPLVSIDSKKYTPCIR